MAKGIGDVIYSLLSNSTDVTDIVSTRIYPFLAIEDVVYPYLVYTIENVDPTVSNCGASSLDTVSVNLEIYTETLAELEDLGDKVRNALDRYKGTTEGVEVQIIAYQNEDYGYADEDRVYLKIQSYNSRLLTISAYFNRVTDLAASGSSDSQIDLTWSDVATGETGYEVWSSSDFISWTLIATTSADAVSYSNTGLTAETPYAYKIRAVDTDDKGVWSNIALGSTESAVVAKSGIAYQRDYFTLQQTSYTIYDDAYQTFSTTNMDFVTPTNPLYIQQLDLVTDPAGLTLLHNNAFGNKFRITKEDGSVDDNLEGYKIDHYTGLGWADKTYLASYDNFLGVGNTLEGLNSSLLYGFSDWMMANNKQTWSIRGLESSYDVALGYINSQTARNHMTSTTRPLVSTNIVYVSGNGYGYVIAKNYGGGSCLACRVHYK